MERNKWHAVFQDSKLWSYSRIDVTSPTLSQSSSSALRDTSSSLLSLLEAFLKTSVHSPLPSLTNQPWNACQSENGFGVINSPELLQWKHKFHNDAEALRHASKETMWLGQQVYSAHLLLQKIFFSC